MAIASKCICGHSPYYCNDSVKECMKRISDIDFPCHECQQKDRELEELKAENERLKGLIEIAYKSGWNEVNNDQPKKFRYTEGLLNEYWDKFKFEHTLQ